MGCLQIMWAHPQRMWAKDTIYVQTMWAESRDVCGSGGLRLWATTHNSSQRDEKILRLISSQSYRVLLKVLHQLTKREKLTLSATIERYLADALTAPTLPTLPIPMPSPKR